MNDNNRTHAAEKADGRGGRLPLAGAPVASAPAWRGCALFSLPTMAGARLAAGRLAGRDLPLPLPFRANGGDDNPWPSAPLAA